MDRPGISHPRARTRDSILDRRRRIEIDRIEREPVAMTTSNAEPAESSVVSANSAFFAWAVVIAMLFVVYAADAAAQPRSGTPPTPLPAGTAAIRGRVTAAESGQAVRKA